MEKATLLNRISIDEAISMLRQIRNLINRFLNIIDPRDSDLVLKFAYQLKITYYDASYVVQHMN